MMLIPYSTAFCKTTIVDEPFPLLLRFSQGLLCILRLSNSGITVETEKGVLVARKAVDKSQLEEEKKKKADEEEKKYKTL